MGGIFKMKQRNNLLRHFEEAVNNSSESRALYVLIVMTFCRAKRSFQQIFNKVFFRLDLWLFPLLPFISTYYCMSTLIPKHPIAQLTILTSAFVSAAYTLVLIRPPKRMRFAEGMKS